MKISKSYIVQSFVILIMASGFFLIFRTYLPQKIFSENNVKSKNIVVDNLMIEELGKVDSVDSVGHNVVVDSIVETKEIISNEPIHNFKGMVYLDSFFEHLYQLESNKTGKVRIAYFGDSMTDGDYIVQDLRKQYQSKYGGKGVGFVSITSESAKSRGSIIHRYSPNWITQSYLKVKKPLKPFGISGHVFFANDTVNPIWVSFKAGQIQNMDKLNHPVLYYGKSNNSQGTISWGAGDNIVVKKLTPTKELNSILISEGDLTSLKVNFNNIDSIPIYGFDFTSITEGIQVDNFSSRGNSGLPLSLFEASIMNRFQENMQYDLIILHYGANVLNYLSHNYNWYAKKMSRVVGHLRKCFPNTTFLIISTADKSTKYGTKMQTDSAVVPLLNAQRKYAIEEHVGFVNLYEAMGGENSMVNWVENNPVRASKDYTHFNFRGSSEVAKLIFNQLEDGFEDYKFRRDSFRGVPIQEIINVDVIIPENNNDQILIENNMAVEKDTVINNTVPTTDSKDLDVLKNRAKIEDPIKKVDPIKIEDLKPEELKQEEIPKKKGTVLSIYRIEEGETIHSISEKTGVPIEEIKSINKLEDDTTKNKRILLIPHKNTD